MSCMPVAIKKLANSVSTILHNHDACVYVLLVLF